MAENVKNISKTAGGLQKMTENEQAVRWFMCKQKSTGLQKEELKKQVRTGDSKTH